ncbi:MAG: ATP-binding protein [Myxococcales bacterium]|nr:ATP-binding protein [Myxococcota bacterium]MDW8283152.1 ATP-binding protein [Myxococcales bacterium]
MSDLGPKTPEGRVTVLYVDDDRANLLAFRALTGDLYDVVTARSGEEALRILAELREVAVLITDQRMPGLGGAELCEQVRLSHPDTVRMLVTAYSDLNAAVDAINRGHVSRYLRKPWNPDELLAALREAAEFYRLTKTVQQLQVRIAETERMYALGVLVAGIGHELRNPLGWITTNLTFCRRALEHIQQSLSGEVLPRTERERVQQTLREMDAALQDAGEGALRVQEIVDGISLSSRNEAPVDQPVDVVHVVRSIGRLVQGEALHRGRLTLSVEEVPPVLGSPTRLGQVLLNLVVNALQALPPRPHEQNVVSIRVYPDGEWVCLEVRDNGVGIAPESLGRIFDPFFTTKGQGTGLGLAISRQIVLEMGGTLDVESEVGVGSRFVVRLPVAPSGRRRP